MPNPVSQVPSRQQPYGGDDSYYFPAALAADIFQTGEMIALNPATGLAVHCDQTITGLSFIGLFADPQRTISLDHPPPILLNCKRSRLFTMPLAVGTLSRGAQPIGTPVYAVDSGHVQFGTVGLTFANKVGYFWDVANAAPENGLNATSIWISPVPVN